MNAAQAGTPPAYAVSGLEFAYGGRVVLRCASLCVPAGSIVGISGPNGSGKSTLLGILSFLSPPTSGSILFFGRAVSGTPYELRRQAVLMPQDAALLRRRVEANVLYGLGVRGQARPEAAAAALERVGLDPARYLRRWWWQLSGGETRRVALAARLALRPRVLLLDEPTANLDPRSADLVSRAVLQARRDQGLSVVVVSHDRDWLFQLCDTVLAMHPETGLEPKPMRESPCAP